MRPSEADKLQKDNYRKMTGAQRLKTALNLTNVTLKMMRDGIKAQLPGLSPDETAKQIALRTGR
jgi:hypothetical protein